MEVIVASVVTAAATIVASLLAARYQYRKKHSELLQKLRSKEADENTRIEEAASEEIEKRIQVFETPEDGSYNRPFYNHFRTVLRAARQNIYITGEGFDFGTSESSEIAESFIEALEHAIAVGNVNVVRIQTKLDPSPEWVSWLAHLVRKYPRNFQLYALRPTSVPQLLSVCAVDPDSSKGNVVEIMLSERRIHGTRVGDLAGTALFVHGKQSLARELRRRVLSLTEKIHSVHINNDREVVDFFGSEHYYFAYGSNLNLSQMKSRCQSAEKVGVAVLKEHEIVFDRKGTYRAGGVATVIPREHDQVFGVIWRVDFEDLLKLDETEDKKKYERVLGELYFLNGAKKEAYYYRAVTEGSSVAPDLEYLELVIGGAKENGLPKDYVERLSSLLVIQRKIKTQVVQ